ncbi:MAG: prolipoprotein diacylglyceryl transferase [Candidatus Omnitrophota bacterium]
MKPVLFTCHFLTIYTYGLLVAVAFLAASWLITREAERRGMPSETISVFTVFLLVTGIIGARLLYVALNLPEFLRDPLEIVKLQHGGLIWFGGFIGALTGGIIFLKVKRLAVLPVIDLCAPYLALGQAIGRIGCFYNGCCYGHPSAHGIFFPVHGETLFPSQILDSFTLLIVFVILKILPPQRDGRVFAAYLMLAALQRFLLEFFRGDVRPFYFSLSFYQWICLAIFAAGVLVFALAPSFSPKKPFRS